jgi:NADP-dependent 3-hydroxy acid dehydrogenase YdfG
VTSQATPAASRQSQDTTRIDARPISRVLVTGASTGIGRATVATLVARAPWYGLASAARRTRPAWRPPTPGW